MTVFLLDLMEQLSSSQKIKNHVDRVVWLKNTLKSEQIVVTIKAELPHYCQFVDETILSILSIEAALLGKCFNGEFGMVSDPLDLINWGEVAFPEFFEGFEHLMKAFSVDFFGEAKDPWFNDMEEGGVEGKAFLLIIE